MFAFVTATSIDKILLLLLPKRLKECIFLYVKLIAELQSVTCRMGLQSVIYHQTQVIATGFNSSHVG